MSEKLKSIAETTKSDNTDDSSNPLENLSKLPFKYPPHPEGFSLFLKKHDQLLVGVCSSLVNVPDGTDPYGKKASYLSLVSRTRL